MKRLVVLFVAFVALFLLTQFSFSQEIDSLILSSTNTTAGDTTVVVLTLCNQSIAVAGFSARLIIPDSSKAEFISVTRGEAVGDYDVFNSAVSQGHINLIGMANSYPVVNPSPPLPFGYHELAVIRIAIFDTVSANQAISIAFNEENQSGNEIVDSTGYIVVFPAVVSGEITVEPCVGIAEARQVPADFALYNNYPNPFNAATNIRFSIDKPGNVRLEVFDVLGREVACLFDEYAMPGMFTVNWRGVSSNGQPVASGIYYYRLSYNNRFAVKKMSFLK